MGKNREEGTTEVREPGLHGRQRGLVVPVGATAPARRMPAARGVWTRRAPIAFGNQTIFPSRRRSEKGRGQKTLGFASLSHDRFAFIVCNRLIPKEQRRRFSLDCGCI